MMTQADKDNNERTLFFFYYGGHGVLNAKGEVCAVTNPHFDQKKGEYKTKSQSPLQNKLHTLCSTDNLYVIALFDCCRDPYKNPTRGNNCDFDEDNREDDRSSAIFYFGA